MAQVKVYALRTTLEGRRTAISDAIHASVVEALAYPVDKRFHRFIALEREDFVHPADRSERYAIVEISMFEGRSVEAKKALVRGLIDRLSLVLEAKAEDVEVTISEMPRHNWGIRGLPGDELALGYRVQV